MDAGGSKTAWTYDESDRVVTRTDGLGAVDSVVYDGAGRVASTESRVGRTAAFGYDWFGRLVSAQYGADGTNASTVRYGYDSFDRLAEVVDSVAGTTTFEFDVRDRVTGVAAPSATSEYSYDLNSQVASVVVDEQPAALYSYDGAGGLSGVSQGDVSVALERDSGGRLSRAVLPGGWTQSYAYDVTGLVTGVSYAHDGTVAGQISYTHSAAGLPASVSGSWANVSLPDVRESLVYDAAHRLVSAGGVDVTYDGDGNMLSDGLRSFTWDERGRLASVTDAEGGVVPFGYAPTGERSSRGTGQSVTGFVDVGANTALELDGAGEVTARLLSGGMDQWFARSTTAGADTGTGESTDAVLTDVLGSPVAFGQADGTLAASYAFDPYGSPVVDGDARGSDLGFTGRQDDGTGLMFHRARYYDPQLGRFISEDPIGLAGGSNLYAYGANAPTAFTDPTGHNPLLIGCVAGGLGDAGISYLGQRLSGRKVQWGAVGTAAATGCVTGMLGGALVNRLAHLTRLGQAANTASRANAPVNMVETYASKPLKPQDAVARWDEFLGPGAHTNLHPRTGLPDADRLVSSDGLRSIRFGNHEMGSSPTKFHFHEETWSFDDRAGVWNLQNIVVRVPFPKGAW